MLTRIPIVKTFDPRKPPIGQLMIETAELPATPDYCFALGYRTKDDGKTYELVCVSIVDDNNYKALLDQRQAETTASSSPT